MKRTQVISQHLFEEARVIVDLPRQTFMQGMDPRPPKQIRLFDDPRCGDCNGGACFQTYDQGDYDHCPIRDLIK